MVSRKSYHVQHNEGKINGHYYFSKCLTTIGKIMSTFTVKDGHCETICKPYDEYLAVGKRFFHDSVNIKWMTNRTNWLLVNRLFIVKWNPEILEAMAILMKVPVTSAQRYTVMQYINKWQLQLMDWSRVDRSTMAKNGIHHPSNRDYGIVHVWQTRIQSVIRL